MERVRIQSLISSEVGKSQDTSINAGKLKMIGDYLVSESQAEINIYTNKKHEVAVTRHKVSSSKAQLSRLESRIQNSPLSVVAVRNNSSGSGLETRPDRFKNPYCDSYTPA